MAYFFNDKDEEFTEEGDGLEGVEGEEGLGGDLGMDDDSDDEE